MTYGYIEFRTREVLIRAGCVERRGQPLWRQVFGWKRENRSVDRMIEAARAAATLQGITLVDPQWMVSIYNKVYEVHANKRLPPTLCPETVARALNEWDTHSLLVCMHAIDPTFPAPAEGG